MECHFPAELTSPAYLEGLIREQVEDFIVKGRVVNAQQQDGIKHFFQVGFGAKGREIHGFFEAVGLRERETLNGIALAGSCQFSGLADQLFGRECTTEWRPDLALRRLATYVIAANQDQFRSFMLHANPRTRRQNKTAGESVSFAGYLRKMANDSTDGDHLTLQALCDALQCPIHIVQLIDSPFSDRMMTHLGAKNVVVSDLNPRPLPDSLRGALVRIQVPRRELWLSLHGEAHFRSLHCFSATKEEISMAENQLELLKAAWPDPDPPIKDEEPIPPSITLPLDDSPVGKMPASPNLDGKSPDPAELIQSDDPCAVCLDTIEMKPPPETKAGKRKRDEGARRKKGNDAEPDETDLQPARPNSCQHLYHFHCLKSWSETVNECPLCKRQFSRIDKVFGGGAYRVKGNHNKLKYFYDDEGEGEGFTGSEEDEDDPTKCYICDHGNHSACLLLCDGEGCTLAAHTYCVGLRGVPQGEWFCFQCQRARSGAAQQSRRPGRRPRVHRAPAPAPEPNAVAVALVQNHGEELGSSTAPWSQTLAAANRAEAALAGRAQPGPTPLTSPQTVQELPPAPAQPAQTQHQRSESSATARSAGEVERAMMDRDQALNTARAGRSLRPRISSSRLNSNSRYSLSSSDSEDDRERVHGSSKPLPIRPIPKRPSHVMNGLRSCQDQPTRASSAASSQAPGFLERLVEAVEADRREAIRGTLAPRAVSRMAEEIRDINKWPLVNIEELLNAGLLSTLRNVFQTVAGRSIVNPPTKAAILRTLMTLPVTRQHILDSRFSLALVELAPNETPENRDLIRSLITNWTHFAKDGTSKSIMAKKEEEHKVRSAVIKDEEHKAAPVGRYFPSSSSSSSSSNSSFQSTIWPSDPGLAHARRASHPPNTAPPSTITSHRSSTPTPITTKNINTDGRWAGGGSGSSTSATSPRASRSQAYSGQPYLARPYGPKDSYPASSLSASLPYVPVDERTQTRSSPAFRLDSFTK